MTVRVVANTSVIGALENRAKLTWFQFTQLKDKEADALDNVSVITYPGVSYYYVGFKLGVFDKEAGEIVEDKEKYSNKKLRQALWHAIDREQWIETFFGGYGKHLTHPIPTSHWIAADNDDLKQYEYSTEKS